MQTDQSIIILLNREPEQGMALLMESYSGLLWTVCCQYLQNTEDVKECVNEAFSEFYLHKERFDPEKGSLKGYLAVIARRCALRRYQENRRWENAVPPVREEGTDPFAHLENREELEAALAALDPMDEQIIRMKYYGGLTAREIAVSLGLPYETVKKRHQRSLKKLLRNLTIGLLIAAILGVLAACTYMVLRHFGFVPGYGVSNTEADVYVLEDGVVIRGERYEFHLEDACWRDGSLIADLKLCGGGNPYESYLNISLSGLDSIRHVSTSYGGETANGLYSVRIIYEGELSEDTGNILHLTLTVDGTDIPVSLVISDKSSVEEAGFYSVTESDGGLLAVPRIENGELVVSIHPLNEGDFCTYSFLNQGPWSGYGGCGEPITVMAPDGTVLEGEPAPYDPFSGDSYLDWYFGPAQPGEYTLNVPYVYQHPASDKEPRSASVALDRDGSNGACISLPGGELKFKSLTPVADVTDYCPDLSDLYNAAGYRWWTLETGWEGENPERTPAVIPVFADDTGYTVIDDVSYQNTEAKLWTRMMGDLGTENQYAVSPGYVLGAMDGWDSIGFSIQTEGIFYRWNHPFSIPMSVPPEEKREEFNQSAGDYMLAAVPRRINGEVTLSLRPSSGKDYLIPSGSVVRSPLATAGETDEHVLLIDGDGKTYMGSFRPGRTDDYSDWTFGDIPAGTYTLHVPWLYISVQGEHHIAIPLPQEEGQTLPVGSVFLDYGAAVALEHITGRGTDTDFDAAGGAVVITCANGAISSPAETPLASNLVFSLQSEEDYILTNFELQLWMAGEASFSGACERQYVFEENEYHMTGLLLRHVPGLYAADLTFVNPVYRWNHVFDIPVIIPE